MTTQTTSRPGRSLTAEQIAARRPDGQFGETAKSEPHVDVPSAPVDPWAERALALAGEGYLPAIAHRTSATVLGKDTATFWKQHVLSAEYGGSVPIMADEAGSDLDGNSWLGKRRTPLRTYHIPPVSVRMPTPTAIKRYRQVSGFTTFDVPVTSRDAAGRDVSGWVRVTTDGVHYDATAMGFPDGHGEATAEAVASLLEARRVSDAGRDRRPLTQRVADRAARRGMPMYHVNSSWIDGLGYDPDNSVMVMTTQGRTYGYRVSPDTFEQVMSAKSPGSMYNYLVKQQAPRVDAELCRQCGRAVTNAASHVCPPETLQVRRDLFSAAARDAARAVVGWT